MRCIEIDVHDGPKDEPIVTHGLTLCTTVRFEEVIQALVETAFATSDLPIIISLEMHCSHKQQVRCAALMCSLLGDALLQHTDVWGIDRALLTPRGLLRKVIVKSKLPPDWMVDRYGTGARDPVAPAPADVAPSVEPPPAWASTISASVSMRAWMCTCFMLPWKL